MAPQIVIEHKVFLIYSLMPLLEHEVRDRHPTLDYTRQMQDDIYFWIQEAPLDFVRGLNPLLKIKKIQGRNQQ